jgi:glucose/arabinose dehydrogenase
MMRLKLLVVAALLMAGAAGCAPEDLDYTPTATPTNTPEPTATRPPTSTPAPTNTPNADGSITELATEVPEPEVVADVPAEQALVEAVIAAMPNPITAGTIQWRRANDSVTGNAVTNPNVEGGFAGRVYFSEAGGGAADVTIAVFETEEAAQAYYENRSGQRQLEGGSPEDGFPEPNIFGGGTYGSVGLMRQGNVVLNVSIPRFSSTTRGNPTMPMAREFLELIDAAQAG